MHRWARKPARRLSVLTGLVCALAVLATPGALATHGPEAEVTVGSDDLVFSQNKQNEPIAAINPINHDEVAAGANDNIDLEACNAAADNTCPFTPGVGVTGFQGSSDGGTIWQQPDYTGFSAREACLGAPGPDDPACEPEENGPIGTLPWYFENDVVSFGDPVQTWGPVPGPDGSFSWDNGARLYFSNLTFNFPGEAAFRGGGAIGVSRTDNFAAALDGDKGAWMDPVLASGKMGATDFSDKEWIAADDAASSPFFGNVYACWVEFRSLGGAPEPVIVARSTDGGDTWKQRQISQAANTVSPRASGRQGCQVDTDSDGVVYVFWIGGDATTGQAVHLMSRSFDGGVSFERPAQSVATVQECGLFDSVQGRFTFDGIAGARTNSFPSVSIANGAPDGDGPDTIVMTWCDGQTPSDTSPGPNERALVQFSTDKGETWSEPVAASLPTDRPDFPAVAISPDGEDVFLTYMAFHAPWQSTTAEPRTFEGVVLHADITGGVLGAFVERHRGEPGDARASSANGLAFEFLGDYNAVSATNDFAVAVWNDAREATDCPAIDAYRQALADEQEAEAPAPQVECPPEDPETTTFGNTDIFATVINDPTP
jgi:hypothetical protein